MTISTRIALGLSAAVISLSLALAPAAFAQDKMGKDDGMKKDTMSKDGMKKDTMGKDDGMKKDTMSKDTMSKDGMKGSNSNMAPTTQGANTGPSQKPQTTPAEPKGKESNSEAPKR